MSGGALEFVYLRRLISAHVSPQPRLMRAVVRHGEASSRYNLRNVVHARLSTRGWALLSSEDLTKLVEQRFRGPRGKAFGEIAGSRRPRHTRPPIGDLQRLNRFHQREFGAIMAPLEEYAQMKRKKSHQPELVAYLCHFRPEAEGGLRLRAASCLQSLHMAKRWKKRRRMHGRRSSFAWR